MNWNALEWDRAAEELTWERVIRHDLILHHCCSSVHVMGYRCAQFNKFHFPSQMLGLDGSLVFLVSLNLCTTTLLTKDVSWASNTRFEGLSEVNLMISRSTCFGWCLWTRSSFWCSVSTLEHSLPRGKLQHVHVMSSHQQQTENSFLCVNDTLNVCFFSVSFLPLPHRALLSCRPWLSGICKTNLNRFSFNVQQRILWLIHF